MHRKAAIRLLNRKAGPVASKRGRPRRYGPEVTEALVKVWQVSDRMCGKLLAAVMGDLVAALERHGELGVSPELRADLLTVSPATIDRLLSRRRRRLGVQPQRRSPASGLKAEVPIRTRGMAYANVKPALAAWRAAHPRATMRETEEAVEEQVAKLRASFWRKSPSKAKQRWTHSVSVAGAS